MTWSWISHGRVEARRERTPTRTVRRHGGPPLLDRGEPRDVHDPRAVDADEAGRGEAGGEGGQRLVLQVAPPSRADQDVVVLGLHPVDRVDGEERHPRPLPHRDPLERRPLRPRGRGEPRRVGPPRPGGEEGARPGERRVEALPREGLQEVVDRVHLERLHRVPVVRRHEDDGGAGLEELERLEARLVDDLLHLEATAVADPLDGEELPRQVQLLAQRDERPLARGEAPPQEVGEEDAHLAGAGGGGRRQRAHRVERVEEEVRVQLRLQRLELGLAREHPGLHRPALGRLRRLEREEDVVERDGEEVEEDPEDEERRHGPPEALRERREVGEGPEDARERGAGEGQERGGDERAGDVDAEDRAGPRPGERRAAAGVERGEAKERVDEGERRGEGRRLPVGEAPREGEQVGLDRRQGDPGEKVGEEPLPASQDGVHVSS